MKTTTKSHIQSQPQVDQHPVLVQKQQAKQESRSVRVADKITAFAGSMKFVYIHAVLFGLWCATGLFGFDVYPYSFLTMTVSLEAIFLSTFVMIGQNRQAAFAEAKADHEYQVEHAELVKNTNLSESILTLTTEVHKLALEISEMQDELGIHIRTTTIVAPKPSTTSKSKKSDSKSE
jgi:uncharacterized membrane protein